jgi:hypothetical protein
VTALGRIAPDAAVAVAVITADWLHRVIVSRTVILALRGQLFPRPD